MVIIGGVRFESLESNEDVQRAYDCLQKFNDAFVHEDGIGCYDAHMSDVQAAYDDSRLAVV